MKKLLPAILITASLIALGCTKQACPTYSHADVNDIIRQDSTPHKFSIAEKGGAILFIYFMVSTISN